MSLMMKQQVFAVDDNEVVTMETGNDGDEDDICPIFLLEIVEDLVECIHGSHIELHHPYMEMFKCDH